MAAFDELPAELIQKIQSLLTQTDAHRTCTLSKSWYAAWSTRPFLHLYEEEDNIYKNSRMRNFATKTLQRYKALNLNLDEFTFHAFNYCGGTTFVDDLIQDALELGVSELDLSFTYFVDSLPFAAQVLMNGSNFKKLSLKGCDISQLFDSREDLLLCPRLVSLILRHFVHVENLIHNVSLGCPLLENLEISNCIQGSVGFKGHISDKFPNLRVLVLGHVEIDEQFFNDQFSYRFPCIENLSLVRGGSTLGFKNLRISSHSLKYLTLKGRCCENAEFDVPNICKFVYDATYHVPDSLKFSTVLREWESHVVFCPGFTSVELYSFVKLRKFLIDLSGSKISLSLIMPIPEAQSFNGISASSIPLAVVENLNVCMETSSPGLLCSVFRSCVPKFITGSIAFIRLLHTIMTQEDWSSIYHLKTYLMRSYILEELTVEGNEQSLQKWKTADPSEILIDTPACDLFPRFRFRLIEIIP